MNEPSLTYPGDTYQDRPKIDKSVVHSVLSRQVLEGTGQDRELHKNSGRVGTGFETLQC